MSLARIPDFSLPILDADRIPFHADPVLAAIERHEEAWSVFQVAPEGEASERAETDVGDALDALLATPCATRFGTFALLRHLCWWLREEAEFSDAYQPGYGIAQAHASDLALLLNVATIESLPVATPLGRLSASVVRGLRSPMVLDAAPVSPPVPALARLGRAMGHAGELLAAITLVAGGVGFVGLASLL